MCKKYSYRLSVSAVLLAVIKCASCSYGDRSYIFQRCVSLCNKNTCLDPQVFVESQPWYETALQWTCVDDCKYHCMWQTVEAFKKDGIGVPQFHGKWPFIRFLGMQEPASVLFSILNGLCHLRILMYHKTVPSSTPMYYIWHISALIGLNTWIWSIIYHTRDTPFTEMMDYFCAFSLVLSHVFTSYCRLQGTEDIRKLLIVAVLIILVFLQHTYYLAFVKFDYGYNMKVNVAFGVLSLVSWLYWCIKNRHDQPYVWKCATVMVGLNALVVLELLDFPPLFWTFDAHSLWHAGTVALGYLWYSFLIEDGLYLSSQKEEFKKAV